MAKDSDKELLDFLDTTQPALIHVLGKDFNKKPTNILIEEGAKRADEIISRLDMFSKAKSFPKIYNPRAVHAQLATAFLLISPYFEFFIKIVRTQVIKNMETLGFPDRRQFIEHMLSLFYKNEFDAEFIDGTIYDYGKMNSDFVAKHIDGGMTSLVQDKLILVIDYTNPIDHIVSEVRATIKKAQANCIDQFHELAKEGGVDIQDPHMARLPVLFGSPPIDANMRPTRTPKTYLPIWIEAFKIRRLKDQGAQEAGIVRELYREIGVTDNSAIRKDAVHKRNYLAHYLIEAAFYGQPLASGHKASMMKSKNA